MSFQTLTASKVELWKLFLLICELKIESMELESTTSHSDHVWCCWSSCLETSKVQHSSGSPHEEICRSAQ